MTRLNLIAAILVIRHRLDEITLGAEDFACEHFVTNFMLDLDEAVEGTDEQLRTWLAEEEQQKAWQEEADDAAFNRGWNEAKEPTFAA